MTEFELVRAFATARRSVREGVAKQLDLEVRDMATEEGVKRQFVAMKAAGKLGDLQQALPSKK